MFVVVVTGSPSDKGLHGALVDVKGVKAYC